MSQRIRVVQGDSFFPQLHGLLARLSRILVDAKISLHHLDVTRCGIRNSVTRLQGKALLCQLPYQ